MKFPNQEEYCNSGVQFYEIIKDKPPGALITREWLPADHPLPDKPPTPGQHRRRSTPTIRDIEIISHAGTLKRLQKSHDKPETFSARITHSNSEQTTHTFRYLDAGKHRVAYSTTDLDWVVKMQCLNTPKNHNLEEWNKSHQMGILNSIIPETHGYKQTRIGGMEVSLLVLHKVPNILADMIKSLSQTAPTEASMATVTTAATIVVQHLVQLSRAGLKPYDWHIWNVAFDDDSKPQLKGFKLIDWAGNHTANAPLLMRERMHKAFVQFSDCFQDFKTWGLDKRFQIYAHSWDTFMKSLHHTLTDWWSEWETSVAGQDVDALPNDDHMDKLQCRFQKLIAWPSSIQHRHRAISLVQEAQQQNGSIPLAVRDHVSSGTSVPDTERPLTLRYSQMTRPPSNFTESESSDPHRRARKTRALSPQHTYNHRSHRRSRDGGVYGDGSIHS